jgi:hypothetical protein
MIMKKPKSSPSRNRTSDIFPLDRRRFLRGLGTAMVLPAFETFLPAATVGGSTPAAAPKRIAFCSVPNGVQQDNWWPTGTDADFQLNNTMKPLEPVKEHLQIIGGLDHENATPGPDGAGDHARANATLLTGVRARKSGARRDTTAAPW